MDVINPSALRSLFLPQGGNSTDLHAAIFTVPEGESLLITVDTMVEGVHFVKGSAPYRLGHKLMAVNLSDLAAMGARPRWATLALVIPAWDSEWLRSLRDGMCALGGRFGVEIIGVECIQGPLNLTLQAYGLSPGGKCLRRAGASPGDAIYVTGTLGDAGLALQHRLHSGVVPEAHAAYLEERLDSPQPRVEAGLALRDVASAALDISDGLVADLGHILRASGVGATLYTHQLPLSEAVQCMCEPLLAVEYALSSGDDYELCFTVAAAREAEVAAISRELGLAMARVGTIQEETGLCIVDEYGQAVTLEGKGYDHFGDE
jgi:thiamine-monophosphate kinase